MALYWLRGQPRAPPIGTLLLVLLLGNSCLAVKNFNEFQFEFEWKTSDWSRCERLHHPMCCSVCVQTRKVTCLHVLKNITVPRHFCSHSNGIKGSVRPNEIRECEECEQDCVLGAWSGWSACAARVQRQHRTRQVLVLPSGGGAQCAQTVDTRRCPRDKDCEGCDRRYRWKVGKWSECRETSEGSVSGMGYRSRSVECTNKKGAVVKSRRCLKARGMPRAAPLEREMCRISQDCLVSEWAAWSQCSLDCLHQREKPGVQSRTREVLKWPQNGGLVCPLLYETRPCTNTTLPKCTSYSWYTSFWSACTVLPNTDLTSLSDDVTLTSSRDDALNVTSQRSDVMTSSDVTCGPGWQQRTVYCTLDADKTQSPVNHLKCIQDEPLSLAPPTRRPCEVPCPVDCQLGEWTTWSQCSQSCGHGGVVTRSRPVLATAMFGGQECGVLSENKPCTPVECSWWYESAWSSCLPDGGETCGPGLRTRFVYCQSIDDRQLNEYACPGRKPNNTAPCVVPCQRCQLQEWGAWQACSQTCGARPGLRTRTRTFLPGNPGGDCEKLELTESQPCGQTTCWTYSWRVGVWGDCRESESESGYVQTRQIVCVDDSMPDRPVPDHHCSSSEATPRPSESQSCVPVMSRDCILTKWSGWTACSATCGDGRQARRRQVLVREKLGKPCPPHDEQGLVFEYRTCSRPLACPEYTWSVDSTWSQCTVTPSNPGTTPSNQRTCGTGVVTRLVHCKYDGKVVDNSLCVRSKPPASARLCYLPCPGDCSLSPWSEFGPCSQTCGPGAGFMVRRRYLLAQRHAGQQGAGTVIQDAADSDYMSDPPISPAYSLQPRPPPRPPALAPPIWRDHASFVLDQAARQYGRADLYRRKRTLKLRKLYRLRQNHHSGPRRRRSVDQFRHWNGRVYGYPLQYSADSQRQDQYPYPYPYPRVPPYRSVFYRDSPRLAPVVEGPGVEVAFRCPHLTDADLIERVPCGQERCPNYSWEVGEWGSCILANESALCGGGTQFRSIQCRREGAVYAHRNQCLHQLHARPLGHNACNVSCPRDCQLSHWSEWTQCSEICGQGTRQRYRGVLVPASEGGRPCARLEEVEVCQIRPCTELQWHATEWTSCSPDYNLTCGPGTQTRQVYCPAGENLSPECERRSQRPHAKRTCDVACRGHCVMSNWASYFPCNCETAVQFRHRTVIRNPAPGGYECGPLTETRRCRCPTFMLKVGNWTDCLPGLSVWQHDIQRRSVTCIQDGRYPVPLALCGRVDVQTTRTCQLPDDRDCVVGEFGPWSQCGECGAHLSKQRHRPVLQAPSGHGKRCPPKHALTQNTTCGLDPCNMYNYHWYVGAWSQCRVEGNGCGFGEQHRLVQCRRNDGVLVKHERCFLQDLQTGKAPVRYNTSQQCGSPCPKDCQITEWSSFGPCYRNCSVVVGGDGYRVRTRSIIKPAGKNGAPCPTRLVEKKPCPPMEAVCPSFQWHVNDWSSDTRDVYCVSQGGMKVSGGCIDSLRPLVSWSCTDGATCSVYATCNQATRQCNCLDDYEGDGRECFPRRGCSEDSHCPINSTRCDVTDGVCICEDGTEPYKGLTCDRRWMEDLPISADDPLQPDFQIWIILAVSLLVLVIIVIGAVLLLRRRTPHSGMLGLNHMVSNNLSDIPKKVSNEYVNIKGEERPRTRVAGTSSDPTPTASNEHGIYMNSEFKVQPRMGISSSNYHLAVNTDDLDDDVFTDDSDHVYLDPNHAIDDEVFLDTPENARRKRLISAQKHQREREKRGGRGSSGRPSHGSQSSTSTVPPACYIQRKRLSTDSSGRSAPRTGRLGSSGHGGIVVRDKPSSASSSADSLKLPNPPSPPDYTPPPPPPPRPNLGQIPKAKTFDFDYPPHSRSSECPQSPKPELPPRSRPPLSMRRVATPVDMPSHARLPVQAPRSRSSQDIRLPTSTLLGGATSSESSCEPGEHAPLRHASRDSESSDTYIHLCDTTWPT